MRLAVISDIHGNLPALEAVAREVGGADKVICLGDVVNYGPWNDECLDLVYSLPGMILLKGNHEALFLGEESLENEIPLVQRFYHASIRSFSSCDRIANLPMELTIEGYLFTHTIGHLRIYKDTDFEPPSDCVIGHTHHAFETVRHGRRVINPGSVGQNRTRIDRACWAWWDTESKAVDFCCLDYPARQVISEMQARRYPPECIAYYEGKL